MPQINPISVNLAHYLCDCYRNSNVVVYDGTCSAYIFDNK